VVAVVPPDDGDTLNEAIGFTATGFTVTVPVFVLLPFGFVAFKVIVKVFALVPVFVNVCETGVPVTTGVPSPKFQDTLAAFVDVLVNSTVSGALPEVTLLLKLATGAIGTTVTFIYSDFVSVSLPAALVAVSDTV